jgi:TonB-dependent starch-binding outer membrane protein SusC
MIFSAFVAGTRHGMLAGRYLKLLKQNQKQLAHCMRISIHIVVLLFCSTQLLFAKKTNGQDMHTATVTLELKNETLIVALKKMQQLTPFTFAYNKSDVNQIQHLNLPAGTRTVKQTLELILEHAPLEFEQIGNNIIISHIPVISGKRATNNRPVADTTITVHGIITGADGKPAPGASIVIKGSTMGTTTNDKGYFELHNVTPGATLVVSSVGFTDVSIPVNNSTTLDIQLTEKTATTGLDEVVVVGYGTVRKKDLTGPVSHISAKDFADRPIVSIDQAMAAQMPGVQVQSITGTPGAPLQIRIRGSSSVSASNDPLYVVDNVPVENLQDIDPATIESIDVLKDASTAAIYGARGSNGVVLITTKKGTRGKARITASVNFGRQTPEKLVDMMSPEEWIQFRKDLADSNWVARGRNIGKPYSASDPGSYRANELSTLVAPVANTHALANTSLMYDPYWEYGTDSLDYVDWQKEFYRPAYISRYNLSASGGNENMLYMLSGEFLNQDGMVPNSNYKRYSFRSNMEIKLNDNTRVGFELAPSFSQSRGAQVDGRTGIGPSVAGTAPIQEKGIGSNSGTVGNTSYRWVADQISPIFQMENIYNNTQITKLLSNAYIDTRIAKGLNLRMTGGWNSTSTDNKNYTPTSVSANRRTAAPGSQSTANRTTNRTQYYLLQAVANYNVTLGDHSINLVAGYSTEQNYVAKTQQRNTGLGNDNLYTFDQGSSTVTISNSEESKRRQLSTFGRLNYNYGGKYLASASFRRDGISRFIGDNKWGFFPAASVAWRISQESFMLPLSHVINDLKFRYSWGLTGNDRITNADRITNSDYPAVGQVGVTSYDFNGNAVTGYSVTTLANPLLKWEKTTSHNIGLDASIINNRITLTLEYYNKTTNDILLAAPIAGATGFITENKNIGSVRNYGYEINIGSVNISKKDFSWNTNFNFSFNKNKVLKLANNNTPVYLGFDKTVQIGVNQPLYSYYLYDAIGVYTSADMLTKLPVRTDTKIGDPIYRDVDDSKTINAGDITNVGHPDPNYIWGMTNRFTYKQFDLSFLLQGQWGNQIFSIFGRNIDRPTTGLGNYNAKKVWVNRFRSEASPGDGKTPRIDASTSSVYDTRWLYSGAFYKIKNLMIGYTLNKPTFIKGLNNLRIYFSAENLWMHDNYDGGFSPEAFQYDTLADWSSYPTARTFSAGINIGL